MSLQADPVRRIFATPMAEVLQRADDPVVTPAGVLPGHAHDEGFDSGVDTRSAWIRAAFGSVELLGNQSSVPGQDGVRFGHLGYLVQSFASESFADVGKRATLRIRQVQPCRQVCAENTVLRSQVFILQEELLVHQPRDIRQQTSPLIAVHAKRPSSQGSDSRAVRVFLPYGLWNHLAAHRDATRGYETSSRLA